MVSRVVSVAGRSSPSRGEKARGMVTNGTVRCWPMGGTAEGHIEKTEWDEEEASKVRQKFSKENNYCDWAEMSVAIDPTSSGSSNTTVGW